MARQPNAALAIFDPPGVFKWEGPRIELIRRLNGRFLTYFLID